MIKNLFIALLLIALGATGSYIYFSRPAVSPKTPSSQQATPFPTIDESENLKAFITQALIAKHGPDAAQLSISISKLEGDYAQGAASTGQGGGMWFAAKVAGQWHLVWDGNGSILCTDLNDYPDFPVSMISECYDPATKKNLPR